MTEMTTTMNHNDNNKMMKPEQQPNTSRAQITMTKQTTTQ